MSRKVKSIRGAEVDFDLIEIKNKIMTAPTPESVHQRERFIDKRRRRGSRKKVDEMLAKQQSNEANVRAAIDEQRKKVNAEKSQQPHVVIEETVVSPETTIEPTPGKRKIRKD